MAIALDGSGHGNNNTGATASVTLTTANANDIIIIVACSNQSGAGNVPALSAISSTNTTGWTLISSSFQAAVPTQPIDMWYGKAASALSGEVISLTFNQSAAFSTVDVFGISGANFSSPLDPSGATDSTGHTANTVTTTGSVGQWMLVGCYRFGGTPLPTAGAGWTAVSGADYQLSEYQIVTTTQAAATVPVGTGAGDENAGVAVGIVVAAGSFGASLNEAASAADVVASTVSAVSLNEVASAHETINVSGGGGMRANTLLWGLVPGWQP